MNKRNTLANNILDSPLLRFAFKAGTSTGSAAGNRESIRRRSSSAHPASCSPREDRLRVRKTWRCKKRNDRGPNRVAEAGMPSGLESHLASTFPVPVGANRTPLGLRSQPLIPFALPRFFFLRSLNGLLGHLHEVPHRLVEFGNLPYLW